MYPLCIIKKELRFTTRNSLIVKWAHLDPYYLLKALPRLHSSIPNCQRLPNSVTDLFSPYQKAAKQDKNKDLFSFVEQR